MSMITSKQVQADAGHSVVNALQEGPRVPERTIAFHRPGARTTLTHGELDQLIERTALYLQRLGLSRGDRVGILSRNRLEWVLLDLAALRLGLVTAGFEAGKFVSGRTLIDTYGLAVLFTDQADDAPGVIAIDRVMVEAMAPVDVLRLERMRWAPEDVSTIKFTSGSTGDAKGLAATVASIDLSIAAVQTIFHHGAGDKLFVFLPLSLLQQRYWIYSALVHGHDVVITTAELAFHALKREAPTVVMGVPAFFEALKSEIESAASEPGTEPRDKQALKRAATHALGPNIRYLWTGSAPARPDVLSFFEERCGVAIFEGYGMNETCIVTKNHPGARRRGSVGRPLPGKHVWIGEDGIIRVRSDAPVNTRYLFAREGASEAMFAPDGTVITGDLGHIDDDGYLYVRGRADDVVVLENGRNILVRYVEERILADPLIENAIVIGSGRTHLGAIVCPAAGADPEQAKDAAREAASAAGKIEERLACVVLADEPFSIENGLLTSQSKPRRGVIQEVYGDAIERAYREECQP